MVPNPSRGQINHNLNSEGYQEAMVIDPEELESPRKAPVIALNLMDARSKSVMARK